MWEGGPGARLFAAWGEPVYTAAMTAPPRSAPSGPTPDSPIGAARDRASDATSTAASPPRLVVLGSGSSGNAYAVTDGETTLLVDCGFSAREVSRRLASVGLDAASVAAVLVTHEHGDHLRGLEVFCRRHALSASVYASGGTRRAGGLDELAASVASVCCGEPFRVGTLEVLPFRASHDAAEPLGYRISSGGGAVGVMTDTGVVTGEALEALSGCEVLGIESNHDLEMLERGPYPVYLKRRIRSAHGHLSNDDAADALSRLAHDGLSLVFSLHRSRTNNTTRLAGEQLRARLRGLGLATDVAVASQEDVCDSCPPQGRLFDAGR